MTSNSNIFITSDGFLMSTEDGDQYLLNSAKALEDGDGDEALRLALEACKWFETAKTTADANGRVVCSFGTARSLNQTATTYSDQDDWESALDYFQKAKAAYDEAAALTDDSDVEWPFEESPESLEGYLEHNIALCYGRLGDNEAAYQAAKESERAYRKAEDPVGQVHALLIVSIAACYLDRKREALSTLNAAGAIARKLGDGRLIERVRGALEEVQR